MKIEFTIEEVEKAIAFYVRESILYNTNYREISDVNVTADGASVLMSPDPSPTAAPAAPAMPSVPWNKE